MEKSEADDVIFKDDQMRQLRSDISDLGHELDARKMAEAAAMGGGVFSALLAGGAAYELTAGNAGVWMEFGIDRETLTLIALGLGALAVALLGWAIVRRRRGNPELEEKLSALEQQYADLRDRKKSLEPGPADD